MNESHTPVFLKIILCFFLFIGTNITNSAESFNKDWTAANILGSFSDNSSFKYYLEPQLRLIDTNSVFNQFLLLGGIGYQINKDITVLLGTGWIKTRTPENTETQERRIWEQLNWRINNKLNWSINSRTRLEQRERLDYAQMSIRLRERMWIRIPFKKWESYSFSCFDELFFNLNHPQWASPYTLEQNRAFIGISKQISNTITIDAGYLNQYVRASTNYQDNVFLLNFSITT